MKRIVSVVLAGVALGVSAQAELLKKSGDWRLETIVDSNKQVLCLASTEIKNGREVYRLEIQRLKDRGLLTEFFIREQNVRKPEPSLRSEREIGDIELLAPMLTSADKNHLYWLLPQQSAALLKFMTDKREIIFESTKSRDLANTFSLRGFDDILEVMVQQCNGGRDLSNAKVEARVLQAIQAKEVNHKNLTDMAKVNQIRNLTFEAVLEVEKEEIKVDEIKKLQAQFQSLLDEQVTLQTRLNDLGGRLIPSAQTAIRDNDATQSSAETRLPQVVALIPQLEAKKASAQEAFNKADKEIAPHRPEHDRLSDDLSDASSRVQNQTQLLAAINSSISSTVSDIQNLEYELSRSESRLNSLEYDRQRLESRYRQAEYEWRRFDVNREYRERLRRDSGYSQAQSDLSRAQSDLGLARQAESAIAAEVSSARQSLVNCQSQPGADCSAQAAELGQLEAQYSSIQGEVRRHESNVQSASQRMDRIERNIRRDVEREEDMLRREYYDAENDLRAVIREIESTRSRIQDIEWSILPQRRQNLEALRNQKAIAESELASAESDERRAARNLDAFETKVGWPALESNYNGTLSRLRSASNELQNAINEKATLISTIERSKAARPVLAQQLKDLQDEQKNKSARLGVVQAELVPYNRDRAIKDKELESIRSKIVSVANQVVTLVGP